MFESPYTAITASRPTTELWNSHNNYTVIITVQ